MSSPSEGGVYHDAVDLSPSRRAAGRVGLMIWDITQTVGLALLIFFSIRVVAQNFKVEGASMEPTLHNGQFLIILKAAYTRIDGTPIEPLVAAGRPLAQQPVFVFGGPERGDIAVFRAPTPPDSDFIKRVVAVP